MKKRLSPRFVACAVLLFLHAALSIVYSLTTPLWESYDETGHYSYARYIAVNHALPPLGSTLEPYNESHQPPLYYVLVALPISLVDTSDNAQPRFAVGGGVYVVPDERIDAFPYHGTALALRLGRMTSVVLSTLCVAITYLTVVTALPRRYDVALLAAALYALWPLTLFLGGTITNDIGMAFFGSLTLLFTVRLWVSPLAGASAWRLRLDGAALAFCVAGAIMTKDSAIALLLFGTATVALLIIRLVRAGWWRVALQVALFYVVPLVVLVIAGGFLSEGRSLRQFNMTANYTSYLVSAGEATTGPVTASLQEKISFLFSNFFRYVWRITFETLFGTFGWGLLRMPTLWYDLAIVGVGVGSVGAAWFSIRRKKTRWLPLSLVMMLGFVALAPGVRTLTSSNLSLLNGRFLLPGLGALIILMAVGLTSLPRPFARIATTYTLAGIALVGIMSPSVVILPYYAKPVLLDPVAAPASMHVADPITYGGSIQLLGYTIPEGKISRGDIATIRLYWRSLRPLAKDYAVRVENFSLDGRSFQNGLNYTPGHSVFPTSFWKPGDTFAEDYYLPVGLDAPAPTLATFKVTWYDANRNNPLVQDLTPVCKDGRTCDPKVGQVAVALDSTATAQWSGKQALYRLGDHIELVDFQAPPVVRHGETVTLTLVWRANAAGLPALTTFVHLLSADNKMLGQIDSPPRNGLYPTNVWGAGEIIPDQYSFRVDPAAAPGAYRLVIGMYDSRTVQRVPAYNAGGAALPDDTITLLKLQVR